MRLSERFGLTKSAGACFVYPLYLHLIAQHTSCAVDVHEVCSGSDPHHKQCALAVAAGCSVPNREFQQGCS
jgi:hypothetical protein